MIASIQHQDNQARSEFERAREPLQAYLKQHPDDVESLGDLAEVLAHLGQADAALAAAQRAVALASNDRSPWGKARARYHLAQIHALLGQAGPAVAILEDMRAKRAIHGSFTSWTLRQDPLWDPIRNDPRFKALLGRFARSEPASVPKSSTQAGAGAP